MGESCEKPAAENVAWAAAATSFCALWPLHYKPLLAFGKGLCCGEWSLRKLSCLRQKTNCIYIYIQLYTTIYNYIHRSTSNIKHMSQQAYWPIMWDGISRHPCSADKARQGGNSAITRLAWPCKSSISIVFSPISWVSDPCPSTLSKAKRFSSVALPHFLKSAETSRPLRGDRCAFDDRCAGLLDLLATFR